MNYSELKSEIVLQVGKAQKNEVYSETIFRSPKTDNLNEFLFFIKPELTMLSETIQLNSILDLFFAYFEKYNFQINNCSLLSAKFLEDFNLISQHYGVINVLSNNAVANVSTDGKSKFLEIYGKPFDECNIKGSLELIKEYSDLSPLAVDTVWQNAVYHKLAGGTYVCKIFIDGKEVFLINGFHPRQLEHFVKPGRSIVVFALSGNIDWKTARTEMIGSTNPAQAHNESIRYKLLQNKTQFGLQTVSSSWNGVHLSAGPVEALKELIAYTDDKTINSVNYEEFLIGRLLLNYFTKSEIEMILGNPNIVVYGKEVSVFDATEEKNSVEAVEILKKYYGK